MVVLALDAPIRLRPESAGNGRRSGSMSGGELVTTEAWTIVGVGIALLRIGPADSRGSAVLRHRGADAREARH